MSNWILVTGGAGYIGSHLCSELKNSTNYKVLLVDIKGKLYPHATQYCDIFADEDFSSSTIQEVIRNYKPLAVVHCANDAQHRGFQDPLKIWENGIFKDLQLIKACVHANVKNFIFLSSDLVYSSDSNPHTENSKIDPFKPIAKNKLSTEYLLQDCYVNYGLNSISFRISNVAGSSSISDLGPLPNNNCTIARCMQKIKEQKIFEIYGNDYNTPDGTILRDYVHVDNVVDAIILGLHYLDKNNGSHVFNLGSGITTSVFELIDKIETYITTPISYSMLGREPAVPPSIKLDIEKIKTELKWHPTKDLRSMILSMHKWYSGNIFPTLYYSNI